MKHQASHLLRRYLQDHLAAAAGGTAFARRMAKKETRETFVAELRALMRDIELDARRLQQVADTLNVTRPTLKASALWVAEKLGRTKLNGRSVRRSPLSLVLELEALQMAVEGKRALWQTLVELSRREPQLSTYELERMQDRADDQLARIRALHDRAVKDTFAQQVGSASWVPSPGAETRTW